MRSIFDVYTLTLRIACIGAGLDAIEILAARTDFATNGPWAWAIMRHRLAGRGLRLRRLADAAFAGRLVPALALALRVAGLVIVTTAPVGSMAYGLGLSWLVVSQVGLAVRRGGLGLSGADGLFLVVFGSCWLATVVARDRLAAVAGLWFIALQAVLAYAVAGVSKLLSPRWRSGNALKSILATQSYGNPTLLRATEMFPALARLLSWAVIVWECLFPLVLLAPAHARAVLLGAGILFHLSMAAVMGLHLFIWGFGAAYPALWAIACRML
jgi:hypothetical protein